MVRLSIIRYQERANELVGGRKCYGLSISTTHRVNRVLLSVDGIDYQSGPAVIDFVQPIGSEVLRRSCWQRMRRIASGGFVRYIVAQSCWMLLGKRDK